MSDIFDLGLSHHPHKPPVHRRFLQIPAIALSILVFVGIAFGVVTVAGKYLKPSASNDYVGDGAGTALVEVHPGDSTTQIGETLVADGVVKTVTAFVDAAQDNAQARDIQPGTYQLRHQMSAQAALGLLIQPSSLVGGRITVPEGARLTTAEKIIAAKSKITQADLNRALANPAALGLPAYANGNAEGFLYPATYDVDSSTTATALLTEMVANFKQVSNSIALDAGAAQLRLSSYDVVKIASLIEAEVKRPEDYPKVAEVIMNRLRRGIPLQLDSTVNYALGTNYPFLNQGQLKTNSPYNTYVHRGLPVGPIDSPGRAALEAALHPAVGNFLYFVTTNPNTGETTFTASAREFQTLRAQAQAAAAAAATAGSGTPASPTASASH